MGVTALRENRYISPAMQLTPEEHEQLIATPNPRLQRLEASDAFQTAVRPRDARVPT